MRDGFRAITSGWMMISGIEDLTERIERAAEWSKLHGPLEPDERATIDVMVEAQFVRAFLRAVGEA